jgi:hypothetical protein
MLDAAAQLRLPHSLHADGDTLAASGPDLVQPGSVRPGSEEQGARPTQQQLWLRNAGLIAGGSLLVGAYGMAKWWDEGFTGSFRTENEGWFGQNTKYGGADKLGHAWFSYVGARLLTLGFDAVGNESGQAQRLGFWTVFGVMTAVEVLDGYSRQYRFSKEDVVMNLAGAGFGYLMERHPDLDQLVDFRLLYRRSEGSEWEPAGDYSGQTYLFAAKASGVPALRENSVLRYFELAAGYGTRGYDIAPGAKGQRNLYFGISLNLSEVLAQTMFRGAKERSAAQRGTDLFLEFIQVPGTAALAKHKL